MTKHPTTQPGSINPNKQAHNPTSPGPLGLPGTDHNQVLYQMCCMHCGGLYAANGSDVHLRKCPACQGGNPSSGDWAP